MPWRDVVYPASWDMNPLHISEAMTKMELTASVFALAAKPKRGPNTLRDPPSLEVCRDGVPWSPAARAASSQGGQSDGLATQDLFCRLTSTPESPAAFLIQNEVRATLPAELLPCASPEKQKDSSPRCSSPECSQGSRSVSPLATLDFPSPLAIRGHLSPTATARNA
ncbi:hypothetical protein T484DRAFT_2018900 [Baffinella frigidus]|nr:hypothetical protein T484DRAFT_2018900 [Cryptophyta sp. CCMP2293]